MDSYIVRIYQRNQQDNREIVGTVHDVLNERIVNFTSAEQLLAFMLHSGTAEGFIDGDID